MALVRRCPALWQDTWPTLSLHDTEDMFAGCDVRRLGSHRIFLGRLNWSAICLFPPTFCLKVVFEEFAAILHWAGFNN